MILLIKNGTVINPGDKTTTKADVLVKDGKVTKIAPAIKDAEADILDAKGCYVMPGFIDLHVHLRDPGLEYKEDIQTGGAAALHGGFTTIVAMPNTKPVADKPDVINYVKHKAEAVTKVHVLQAGAVTKGQKGEELADIRGMAAAGSPAISEDGKSVMNAQLYREGMKIAAEEGLAVLAHCEDINMVHGGVLNADAKSKELGFAGITNSVEDVIVARDILLAKETGVRLHLCHCSTKDSVRMVELAKEEGLPVTAEVCPHHFCMTSDDITEDNANYKMNPPLRTKEDVEALKKGLADDIMDVIATDHAPHAAREKEQGIQKAPFGIVGLETAAALTYTELVKPGILTPMQMAEKMSYNPAKVLRLEKGTVAEGSHADLTIFDPECEWVIDPAEFLSKGKNTPFGGRKVTGKVKATIVDGEIAYLEK
ncbi:dihydroorotase [uncultured Eubacterium sp.]|uniref:dihydroorotase n=1 Tax=uncultured Eubacterium sp. TaxID=165185 RepID=UPI0025F08B26|nr:dihydroorotase [uncultured Eubacterium sp.]